MRRIGLIGGMSWESTAEYYRLLNERVRTRLGGLHSAECLVYSVDFAHIEVLQARGEWAEAGAQLAAAARALEAAGAELLLLCTNTMHIVAEQVQDSVRVPLLHLADVTAAAVTDSGRQTVGLLGTAFTMDQPYYRERLESHGLKVMLPEPVDRELIHRVIYDELCVGIVSDNSRQAYLDVIDRLAEGGAQGVILGCTEIELLVDQSNSEVALFPTTTLHVEAALDVALR
jgi:aspartate racemase